MCLKWHSWDTWVAQLFKCLTLDFGSRHDLVVCGIEPHIRLHADSTEPAWDFLSSSISVPTQSFSLFLSQ